jgi:deoxycytidylate deaminase
MPNRPNLVFVALISPIGIDLNLVQTMLEGGLKSVSYDLETVRLTDFFSQFPEKFPVETQNYARRYNTLIDAGNKLREITKRPDIFSLLSAAKIKSRLDDKSSGITPDERKCVLIRQLKRPEEVATLQEIYGQNIIFVSCFAPKSVRVRQLSEKIAASEGSRNNTIIEAKALNLIGIDEKQEDNINGQRMMDAYHLSDFILDCSDHDKLSKSVDRFIRAFWGEPFITPNTDEYGAYMAKSASLRSSDLSRQVGAAIFGKDREIIALGCNEVPKFGGGTYWCDDGSDYRDFRMGEDSNQRVKSEIIKDILARLKQDWLKPELQSIDVSELYEKSISKDNGPIANAMINDIIEFGRMIHAEMNAITDAARFRRSTVGATLYCTTLPCHMCTRHIIAAGITKVVYIEPYYKSMSKELYHDSIAFDLPEDSTSGRVYFGAFTGITPKSFHLVFSKGKRKDKKGKADGWVKKLAMPIFTTISPYYVSLQTDSVSQLDDVLRNAQLIV